MNIQINITIGLLLASILVNTSSGRYFMKTDDDEEAGSGQDGLTWPFKSQILSMVEHLRDDINSAKQKLRVKNDQLQRSFALLKIDYLKVKYFNDKLTEELQELKTSNQQLEAAQKQIQERLSSVETGNSHGSRSAFSAYMDTGSYRPSDDSRVVVPFKGVRYNLGKDYNPATSTYTCPVGGVYYFSYAVHSGRTNNRQGTFAYISVDNQSINSASCSTTGSAGTRGVQRCQATNSATVYCEAGSHVQIKTTGAHIMIYGTTAYDRTTFTGFLLYQD